MATIQEKIAEAIAAGYSAEEIKGFLKGLPEMEEAFAAAGEDATWEYLGLAAKAPQLEGPGRIPAMIASGLVQGALGTLGLPGTIEELGYSVLPETWTRPIGSPEGTPPDPVFPTMDEMIGLGASLGLVNRPDLKPQDTLEKYVKAGSVGTGGALSLNPLAVVSGAASGLAAQGAEDFLPGVDWAPVAAAMIGGMGVDRTGAGVKKILEAKTAEGALKAASEHLDTLRINSPKSKLALNEALEKARLVADETFKAAKGAVDTELGQALAASDTMLEATAGKFGKAKTLQEAGTKLQDSARKWLEGLPTRVSGLWKPLDDVIPPETPVSLDAFSAALKDINKSGGGLSGLVAEITPKLPRVLQAKLKALQAQDELGEAVAITWSDVQTLRSALGDAMSNPMIIKDIGQGNLSQMYATITADLGAVAKDMGAEGLFAAANKGSRELYDIAEGPIAGIVAGKVKSADDPLPETVARRLLTEGKHGASNLAVLRSELPDALNDLTSVALRDEKLWPGLAPEAKATLVPDPMTLGDVENTWTSRTVAKETAKGKEVLLKEEKSRVLKDAMRLKQVAGTKLAEDEVLARVAFEHARKKFTDTRTSSLDNIAMAAESLAFGGGAAALGGLTGATLPHGAALIGAALPLAYKGAKRVIAEPEMLLAPARGAAIANSLTAGGGLPAQ